MAKLHWKMRNNTEPYFRIEGLQAPKIEPANLKLSAMSCRSGRILKLKCQTIARSLPSGATADVVGMRSPYIHDAWVVAIFGVTVHPAFQLLSAFLTGIGYGLVYSVLQTWAVNNTAQQYRHAALT